MSWPLVELGDLAVQRGGSVDPQRYPNQFFELYSIPAYDTGNPETILGSEIGSAKKLVKTNDVMVSRIVPHIRRAWIVGSTGNMPQIASGEWIVFRGNQVYPPYLRWFLLSDLFHRPFMQTVSGVGGSLLRAKPSLVNKIQIPLPPLPEQKRIAKILDQADALRAKRREAIAKLDTFLQSTFLDMFGDPVTNPKGWELATMQSIVDEYRPITYGILKPGPDLECGIPYVRVVDIREGQVLTTQLRKTSLTIAGQYKRSRLKPGDLLMSIRGHVGRMAITPESIDGANITQDTARLAIVGAKTRYVMHCIATQGMQDFMARRTKGVAVRGINLGDVKKLPIPIPHLKLQQQFADIVTKVEAQKQQMRDHLTQLDTLFASLQSRAFNGEL